LTVSDRRKLSRSSSRLRRSLTRDKSGFSRVEILAVVSLRRGRHAGLPSASYRLAEVGAGARPRARKGM
jgi:hypothetical protein